MATTGNVCGAGAKIAMTYHIFRSADVIVAATGRTDVEWSPRLLVLWNDDSGTLFLKKIC